jgi:thioester reductase-like protein
MSPPSSHTNDPQFSAASATLRIQLRDFAARHLPAATVPARFVVLPELPKLPNGKVDRKQLAALPADGARDRDFVPPETPEELRLAAIWTDLLGAAQVGLHDDFFELGGNSLTAVQMAARVRAETGVAINLRAFFEGPTLARLARLLDGKSRAVGREVRRSARSITPAELAAEARLPDDVRPEPGAAPIAQAPYAHVFVTGGTGYTGAFLLRELLDRSAAHLSVLTRGSSPAHALGRIRAAMEQYGVWQDGDEQRLTALVGDLARPYFGLSRASYRELAERAEMIVHNGALSSYALAYPRLKATNVLGTLEVLRLACRSRVKPVHYVSSLAVYPGRPGAPRWLEEEVADPEGVVGGYRQTKWVGDAMLAEARRRGVPSCVYRAGLITGAQTTGACTTDTFINAVIKGCIQLGSRFEFDAPLEATPVDFCAAAMAHVALGGGWHGTIFNLPGARTMAPAELFERVEEYGYPLRHVTYRAWYRELAEAVERGDDNEMTRFFPLFGEDAPSDEIGYQGARPVYDTTNLRAAIAGSGIAWAEPDRALWHRYLDWFVAAGFLPAPPRGGAREGAR